MKVLLLHQFYNTPATGGALRSYYLSRALADAGMKVTVLTTHNEASIKTIRENGVEVHYLPVTYNNRYGFFKRIISFFRFVWHIVQYAGQFRNSDVVYAISAPLTTGLAALWIKFRYGIPFYFEVGDLWPEAPIQLGIIRNPLLKKVLFFLEALTYRQALAVIALSHPIRENISMRFPSLTVHVIPNMADTDFYKPEIKQPEQEHHYGVKGKFVVSYIGTLGMANGLEYVIDCATIAEKNRLNIHFLICGDGQMYDVLRNLIAERRLAHVTLTGPLDRQGVRDVLSVTDAVWVCFKPLPVLETGSPNKFFDGLASGKLILINFGGWIKEEIEETGCGVALRPADPDDFVQKIKPFLQDPELLLAFQRRARQLAEMKYSRKILSSAFTGLFQKTHLQV